MKGGDAMEVAFEMIESLQYLNILLTTVIMVLVLVLLSEWR